MPSGKQARRARQAARQKPPPVKGAARARRQASPKVLGIAAGALLVIGAIVAVVIVVAGGASSKPPAPLPGAADVSRLLSGVPQSGNTLGDPTAPVTLVEYVDLQCPVCKAFEEDTFPGLVRKYVRRGKLQIQSRPIAFIGTDSQTGQLGAIAAGQQDRMFNFMQVLYENQGPENSGWLDSNKIDSAAVSSGIDLTQFRSAVDSSEVKKQAASNVSQAATDNVRGTPTLLVGKTGQTLTEVPYTQVAAAVEQLTK